MNLIHDLWLSFPSFYLQNVNKHIRAVISGINNKQISMVKNNLLKVFNIIFTFVENSSDKQVYAFAFAIHGCCKRTTPSHSTSTPSNVSYLLWCLRHPIYPFQLPVPLHAMPMPQHKCWKLLRKQKRLNWN